MTGAAAELGQLLAHASSAARANGRADLEATLRLAIARMDRPETVVCVAGEFKQGKSSLVNGLLGVTACPVDDDLATAAVTLVRHGPRVRIQVTRRASGTARTEVIDPARLADYVTERGNPGNERRVEMVEIQAPNALLEQGWAFVDTPGIGGLNQAQAAAALGFLPAADALLFVTDASAELGREELEFLDRARAVCPTIIVALSKIDLYPAWREVAAADARQLGGLGLPAAIPVSSVLRAMALRTADRDLNDESGVPFLLERLHADVMEGARARAATRAVSDARRVLLQLATPLARELTAVRDPNATAKLDADLKMARERLQALRGPASRWGQRLGDGFGELGAQVDYAFRARMRTILRSTEEAIDRGDPAHGWNATATALQADVAAAVATVFEQLLDGATRLRHEIAALIEDAALEGDRERERGVDVGQLWSGKVISRSVVSTGVGLGFGALRGAQSGVYMLGLLGNLFHLAVIGPALLGGAALFAGKSIVDERRRQLAQRRQDARQAVRQYLDDVQFEVGTRVRDVLRELQRELRDDVANRMEELNRTHGEAAAALERTLKQDAATRAARATVIETELKAIHELDARLERAAAPQAPPVSVAGPAPALAR